MLINIFTSKDNKHYLYLPFISSDKTKLEDYEIPEEVARRFKTGRFITTVNTKQRKLIQIDDQEQFEQAIADNGFYLKTISDDFLENLLSGE